jgi:hypothetical protein
LATLTKQEEFDDVSLVPWGHSTETLQYVVIAGGGTSRVASRVQFNKGAKASQTAEELSKEV